MRMLQFKKKNVLYLIELFVLLMLVLGGIFTREKNVFEASEKSIPDNIYEENGSVRWQSDGFKLNMGVYRIVVESNITGDSYISMSVQNPSPRVFREILANDQNLYSGQQEFTYEITVTAAVEEMYLQGMLCGNPAEIDLINVTVQKTNQMYWVLLIVFLILFTILNLLLYLRSMIRENRIQWEQQMVVWVLAATVLLGAFPYLVDYISGDGETLARLYRTEAVKNALLGQKELSFAAGDLLLIIPAFLRIVGFTMEISYRMFHVGLLIVVTMILYLCFRYCMKSKKGALLGTVLYVLAPGRIYGFYGDGAAEGWLGLFSMLCAVVICICIRGLNKSLREKAAVFAASIVAGTALYLVNDIVFQMAPVYLYHMAGSNVPEVVPENIYPVTDMVPLLLVVVFTSIKVFVTKKRGKVHG